MTLYHNWQQFSPEQQIFAAKDLSSWVTDQGQVWLQVWVSCCTQKLKRNLAVKVLSMNTSSLIQWDCLEECIYVSTYCQETWDFFIFLLLKKSAASRTGKCFLRVKSLCYGFPWEKMWTFAILPSNFGILVCCILSADVCEARKYPGRRRCQNKCKAQCLCRGEM